MSIPLDRLYHYIESIAKEVRGDDVIIYRFYPHGSKKIEHLQPLYSDKFNWYQYHINPQIYCNDQEPLNFQAYQNIKISSELCYDPIYVDNLPQTGVVFDNLRIVQPVGPLNINDCGILLHSEQRSENLDQYKNNQYIPAYYWSHAVIALDWFRYAQHEKQISKKIPKNKFLIYNRAWAGTREYRLKFVEYLISNNLESQCQMQFNTVDPEIQTAYDQYNFINPLWKPNIDLAGYFDQNLHSNSASADFDLEDYNNTDIEVVLETLFDDQRLHLTEKSLRPIACGQPFILVATHGSLEYLRSYGFQTFNSVFDESYDTIENPTERLKAVIKIMLEIANWTPAEREHKIAELKRIADYNHQHMFSSNFSNYVLDELKINLHQALLEFEKTNTGKRWLTDYKLMSKNPILKKHLTSSNSIRTRQDRCRLLLDARNLKKRP